MNNPWSQVRGKCITIKHTYALFVCNGICYGLITSSAYEEVVSETENTANYDPYQLIRSMLAISGV